MELPEDPMMLFSVINMNISKDILIGKLESIGFEYNAEQNKFW